jgi:hypothetical protein
MATTRSRALATRLFGDKNEELLKQADSAIIQHTKPLIDAIEAAIKPCNPCGRAGCSNCGGKGWRLPSRRLMENLYNVLRDFK